MAVKALGKENVLAVSLPCNSISADFADAKLVADTFGVKFITIDLGETFKVLYGSIDKVFYSEITEESSINIKPRLRMTTLYAIAQSLGYLVIGTGNLSEAMVRIYDKMGR